MVSLIQISVFLRCIEIFFFSHELFWLLTFSFNLFYQTIIRLLS